MTKLPHNIQYEQLQDEYIKTRDSKILGKMYEVAKECANNYIRNYVEKHGIRGIDIEEKAHDSAMYIIEQHVRKPEWRIKSLSSYMWFGMEKSLFDTASKEWDGYLSSDELKEKNELEHNIKKDASENKAVAIEIDGHITTVDFGDNEE